ncbi:zinc finger, C4 type [Ancylostoma caninum]|uniref:Zinc finger, C4 type n=1 Tax=Ancylostoma caninum TaxID=29170 RepID=A0A368F149_ANCCA|nr:zinc finger, C4 type [Ancylostoma caninum]
MRKCGEDPEKREAAETRSSRRCREGPIIGPCVVCEDPRGSIHFGVVSCAACSAFFRRTIAENRKYSCRRSFDGHFNCPIDQKHRCYCRACRLQKCLLMGMDPGSVQLHRDTYGSKIKRALEQSSSCHQPNTYLNLAPSPKFSSSLKENVSGANSKHIPSPSSATLAEQLLHFSRTTVIAKKSVGDYSTDRDRIADDFETPSPSMVPKQFPISVTPPVSCPSSEIGGTQSRNMIEGMVDSYRQMLERRRLVYCPSSIRDILSGTMPVGFS